jgi:hypothetical protein
MPMQIASNMHKSGMIDHLAMYDIAILPCGSDHLSYTIDHRQSHRIISPQ